MLARLSAIMATARLRNVTTARATVAMPVRSMGTGSAQLLSVSRSRTVGAAAGLASKRSVKQSALSARGAARALAGQGVPATCPIGGATADSHGLSRLARQEDPQVSQSAGDGTTAPQTSQADSAGSIPVTRSTAKHQVSGSRWSLVSSPLVRRRRPRATGPRARRGRRRSSGSG